MSAANHWTPSRLIAEEDAEAAIYYREHPELEFDFEENKLERELFCYRDVYGHTDVAEGDTAGWKELRDQWGFTDEWFDTEFRKTWEGGLALGKATEHGRKLIFAVPLKLPNVPKGLIAFTKPRVYGTDFDFIISPAAGDDDGWFVRGDVNLVGGASGAGKSSFMIPLLTAQAKGDPFLGFKTHGLPYLLVIQDRSLASVRRTFHRLKCDMATTPFTILKGGSVPEQLARAVEAQPVMPAVVFFEGLDLVASDASKMGDVAELVSGIQAVVSHYHIAFIGTVGSPKLKVKDAFKTLRDQFFGSVAWGRMSETMLLINEEKDGTRKINVLKRNGQPDKFVTAFVNGRLEVVRKPLEVSEDQKMMAWFRERETFTRAEFQEAFELPLTTTKRKVDMFVDGGVIKGRPGKHRRMVYRAVKDVENG